ncbi:MAG: prepilin-type N-terminal cleavage/methylation domain-containing protein [Planctomycetota bacterium]|jgi:prepilin-type N-terminal cleavage/methylation domain-containing protein|nr:prepilin-type N-terminal cleavage/methylation domain-containing protein [Planctomycetota bacterium]
MTISALIKPGVRGLTLVEVLAAAALLAVLAAAAAPVLRSIAETPRHKDRVAALEYIAGLDQAALLMARDGSELTAPQGWRIEVTTGQGPAVTDDTADDDAAEPEQEPLSTQWLACRVIDTAAQPERVLARMPRLLVSLSTPADNATPAAPVPDTP